jgi:Arylsulfotransferase (ASST)
VRVLIAGLTSLAGAAGVVGLVVLPSAHTVSAPASTSPSCVPPALNVSAALAGSRVTVSPGPTTRDASPVTQISMLGVRAGELSGVTVKGSRTGAHSGRLVAYSQGDGASFLPSQPFDEGELVSVHADVVEGARTIPFAWSFTVAVRDKKEAASAGASKEATSASKAAGASASSPAAPTEYQSFRSRPDLRPPIVTVSSRDRTATGDLFLAPYSGDGQYGPMILDEHGGLIWFDRIPPGARAADFRVQQYEGKPVLTWWQDPLVSGADHKAGMVIANSAYQQIAVVRAGNGYQADLHEFQISPQGTALVTVYDAIDCDVSSVGGPRDGAVADTLLQELDLKTGLVMYEWHSLDHVALERSYASASHSSRAEPFDYFHINSTDVQQDGDLLVDSRNTWAAYDLDAKTGQVRWQLGGKHSSFKLGPGTSTAWQHDARQQPDGAITFFDNGAFPRTHPQSRAIEVALNTRAMTATLVRRYEHVNPLVAGSQGNVQVLTDGDWVVGWGQAGYLSEVTLTGQVLFNAHLPPDWESYRTYALAWSGHPAQPPALTVVPSSGTNGPTTLYASWNGATEVASWRVLAGSSPTTLTPVLGAARIGFETAIALPAPAGGPYVAVQALNGAGAPIGVSATVKISASA